MTDPSDDLSIRARRGTLDEGQKRQLALLLHGSLEARLAHRAGCEFDAHDSVLPGDEALAERISERLLLARPLAPRVPRRWLKPALAAGAVAALALAFAAPFSWRERPRAPSPPAPSAAPAAVAKDEPSSVGAGAPALSVAIPPPASSSHANTGSKPSSRSLARPRVAESSVVADTGESASELFARANRARREAEPKRAVALYELLQKRYPSAPEAQASVLALGVLKLSLNQPAAALRYFDAYLARSPQGELGSEALWGRARAYLALGRKDLAKKSFQLLLSQYPESAYAGAARGNLQNLP